MYDAFSGNNADFTGLREEPGLFINKVIHKTYLKVFEYGCEAAGATVIDFDVDICIEALMLNNYH